MEHNALLSFLPLVMLLGIAVVTAIPYWRICERTGLSKGLVAVIFIPAIGWFILLWIIAFSKWPNVAPTPDRNP
jgi:hypothetical protein